MCDFLFGKNMSTKTEFGFRDQVTYWEGKMMNRNTHLNPYTYNLY